METRGFINSNTELKAFCENAGFEVIALLHDETTVVRRVICDSLSLLDSNVFAALQQIEAGVKNAHLWEFIPLAYTIEWHQLFGVAAKNPRMLMVVEDPAVSCAVVAPRQIREYNQDVYLLAPNTCNLLVATHEWECGPYLSHLVATECDYIKQLCRRGRL